jgi:hypothetical protein
MPTLTGIYCTAWTKELIRHQFLNVVFTGVFVWCGLAVLKVLNVVRNRVLNFLKIWYTTQLNTPPPPTATHCLYTFTLGRGRGGEIREKVKGQQFTRFVENANMTVSPVCKNSIKHQ